MQGLYQFNATITHFLEGFLETAVPMIAGLAEVVGLFIIITSLAKASYHYVRATFFNDHHDFHHEMSSGLTTALEFLDRLCTSVKGSSQGFTFFTTSMSPAPQKFGKCFLPLFLFSFVFSGGSCLRGK